MRLVVDCRFVTSRRDDPVSCATRGLVGALGERHPLTMLISDHAQLELLPPLPWQLLRAVDDPRELLTPLGLNSAGVDVAFSPAPVWGSLGRRYALVMGSAHPLAAPAGQRPSVGRRLLRPLRRLAARTMLRRADAVAAIAQAGQRDAVTGTRAGQPVVRLEPRDIESIDPEEWSEPAEQLMSLFYALHRERRSAASAG
ncbi:hypothetical protein SAMN04489806_2990 [Paramicrobacterium humi]|uniref:Uncharacterized protein n=1 Tax=Paramicrobacterium humi TaxID=640635 RepID=A0A1H4R329_9MICO|nr:hypothetical protein [Microbacterium humi]SEC26292.1 hypothetical protein SAMN04489806_2990 [Microbacterium humi]